MQGQQITVLLGYSPSSVYSFRWGARGAGYRGREDITMAEMSKNYYKDVKLILPTTEARWGSFLKLFLNLLNHNKESYKTPASHY